MGKIQFRKSKNIQKKNDIFTNLYKIIFIILNRLDY